MKWDLFMLVARVGKCVIVCRISDEYLWSLKNLSLAPPD